MEPENIYLEIKDMLDYLDAGPSKDAFYREKCSAVKRRLEFHINRVPCDELRRILKKKMKEAEKDKGSPSRV